MRKTRFPLRRYLRTIADIEQEWHLWQLRWQGEAQDAETVALTRRLEERAWLLERLRPELHSIFHELEQMPRLS